MSHLLHLDWSILISYSLPTSNLSLFTDQATLYTSVSVLRLLLLPEITFLHQTLSHGRQLGPPKSTCKDGVRNAKGLLESNMRERKRARRELGKELSGYYINASAFINPVETPGQNWSPEEVCLNGKQLAHCTTTLLSHCLRKSMTFAPILGWILDVPTAVSWPYSSHLGKSSSHVEWSKKCIFPCLPHHYLQSKHEYLLLCEASKNQPKANGQMALHASTAVWAFYLIPHCGLVMFIGLCLLEIEITSYSSQIPGR